MVHYKLLWLGDAFLATRQEGVARLVGRHGQVGIMLRGLPLR
jgi:hypothetical protein